jgi:hypothetical protein
VDDPGSGTAPEIADGPEVGLEYQRVQHSIYVVGADHGTGTSRGRAVAAGERIPAGANLGEFRPAGQGVSACLCCPVDVSPVSV